MPSHLVIGGGVNGLSVAWALAERGADVLVLDKGRIGSGASGIAGGIVRNYYRAAAITELVRLSVEMFEEDPDAYGFRQVGYIAAVPDQQADDLVAIRAQHERAGYESELVTGADRCHEYLTWTWPDWEAPVAALLHERRGGWADAMQTVRHLAGRARAAGVEIARRRGGGRLRAERRWGRGGGHRRRADRLRRARGGAGAVGGARVGAARARARVDVAGERRPLLEYWKAQEGEFALARGGPERLRRQRGARGAPRSGRAAALRPRRRGARRRPVGDLLPHGPHRHRHHGRRAAGVAVASRAWTRTAPTTPTHAAEPEFRDFFTSGPRDRASAASAAARTTGA